VAGASIEATLELWASSLRDVKARMRPLFTQERVAASAGAFLDGLLGNEQRKTGWMRAEAAGDPGPWRQQAILGRGRWEADDLRDIVRGYVLETLADDDAVLVFDETGFLKQGKASCGVARQYTGSAGKITNCQIGVFACYVSRHGHAFIDRSLYVPKGWTDDAARMKAAHVPEKTAFATKPALAVRMIERAIATAVPFAFVAADSVYGVAAVEGALRRAGKGYVLGVASNHSVNSWGKTRPIAGTAERVAQGLAPSDWKRLSAGDGAKGPRLYDWAYVELADLDASEYDASRSGLWTRGLLIRRTIADHDLAFFSTWAPAGTSIDKLVRVEGCRWAIEDSFETAKNELGLDHNETRSWHGWHRHVSLVMLAFAMMATIRHRANAMPAQQTIPQIFVARRLSAGPFRKFAA
jgi:SRSO17 transposase